MTSRDVTLDQFSPLDPSCEKGFDALVAVATDGSIRSFEELVWSYKHTVLAIGQRMCGNASDAEDIAQQTFMKVFIHLATFRKESAYSICTPGTLGACFTRLWLWSSAFPLPPWGQELILSTAKSSGGTWSVCLPIKKLREHTAAAKSEVRIRFYRSRPLTQRSWHDAGRIKF